MFAGLIIVSIILHCSRDCARTVPNNYILLFLFTFFESYFVSLICALSDPNLVLMAAVFTFGIFFALTVYAFNTKSDFTLAGGILFIACFGMIIAGIFLMFTNNNVMHIIYCIFGMILFGIYIIYDT